MVSTRFTPATEERHEPVGSRLLSFILHGAVFLLGLLALPAYYSLIPDYYHTLTMTCVLHDCGLSTPAPPTTEKILASYGLTPGTYAFLFVLIDSLFTTLFALSAFVIYFKSRKEPMASLSAVMLLSLGISFPALVYTAVINQELWEYGVSIIGAIGWITFFLFFALFPNGRFTSAWDAIPLLIFSLVKIIGVFFPETVLDYIRWPFLLSVAVFVLPIAAIIRSQFYRYRKLATPEQKQQTKWIVYGVTVGLISFIAISILFDPGFGHSPLTYLYLNGFLHFFLLIIPLTLAFAILRKRLWDVDPVVNRTLVYTALSVCIVAVYGISIFYLGKWFGSDEHYIVSLASTVVVAVLFAPLRDRLQRMVNRLMKGRHDDPFGMLTELKSLLMKPLPPDAMLHTMVRFIRQALRIPYAAIVIEVNGQERLVSSDGASSLADHPTFPIVHLGKEAGALLAANRKGEPFTSQDLQLLDVLIGHAGPIVDNFTMTIGMKMLADDLQLSREKLVLAREEERRHIRRNLHDELAPRLAAIGLNATAAEMYVKRNPKATTELLADLRKVIRSTVEDIRSLVHDMRPASLDEWGLTGAIQERIREVTKPLPDLRMELHAPSELPELPAAVEVAAYWIVSETIANVVRHSGAKICSITLSVTAEHRFLIEVKDDGIGIDERALSSAKGGIGIGSIRERASELGGHCIIERLPEGGSRVLAIIPFMGDKESSS